MLLNVHTYYSLRYGTLSVEKLTDMLISYGYDTAVVTDINTSSGVFEYIKICRAKGINGLVGMEYRNGDKLLYIGIARNFRGLEQLNNLITSANLAKERLPENAPVFDDVYVVYPYGTKEVHTLRENEFIGVQPKHLNKVINDSPECFQKYVVWQPVTFIDKQGFKLHCQLRAINNNILLSQLNITQVAARDEIFISKQALADAYKDFPQLLNNTERLLSQCTFEFDFTTSKNKKTFTGTRYDDKQLLEKLAYEGLKHRYGVHIKIAVQRVRKELDIIDQLEFSSYFLISWDIVRYGMSRSFYHVGRGSGANSVVAYCLRITDVCPIELDLYFERFLNPKRKSPPDFDIDFSWDERDDVFDYIFKRYGEQHTALMGAMSTFRDKSIIRELGKVYGLPKSDIDRIIDEPDNVLNKHEITNLILSVYTQLEDFPNLRTIHSSGVLISELPITAYTALDMPPKGFKTAQMDMYSAEDIGFEKFDILSQRGIGHIKETVALVAKNRGTKIDVHEVEKFKVDEAVKAQLKSGDTIGCFYVESPAMRGLLKKLRCNDYLTLVAASSIIRPGVAKSGIMREYIQRFHNPTNFKYLHPVMEEQLKETYGVMVFQEDVLKVGHHFGGLDLADADVLRRMMSGKGRDKRHLLEIEAKYFVNCKSYGYPETVAKEVWRQIESFAGYSFSKAHSASFAVESFQSLFLKTYYPLEFMVAVINNFGGFYSTRLYVSEARKAGGTIYLPCVNRSDVLTSITGADVFLGFIHMKGLESEVAKAVVGERTSNGLYVSLEDFINRTRTGLEQVILLIRIGAFRFTCCDKKELLFEAHCLLNGSDNKNPTVQLFQSGAKKFTFPKLHSTVEEDFYDEMELLGFPVSCTMFDMLRTSFRGEINGKKLIQHVGKEVRLVGDFITAKYVPTVKRELMAFGTFLDVNGEFYDTVHFPPSFKRYPMNGLGAYLMRGRVVQEFGFPSIEVDRMEKLPIKADPRSQ